MIKTINLSGDVGYYFATFNLEYLTYATADLAEGDTLEAIINSPGGDVSETSSMMSVISSLNKKGVKTVAKISGYALSAASFFVFAFERIEMSRLSWMMIHDVALSVSGTAKELEEYARLAQAMTDSVAMMYEKKTGKSKDEFLALMDSETWFSAQEALDIGFIDSIDEQVFSMVACFDQSKYNNAPIQVLNTQKGGSPMSKKPEQENQSGAVPPMETVKPVEQQNEQIQAVVSTNVKTFEDGVSFERTRVASINKLALPGQESLALQLVNEGKTIEQAKDLFLENARVSMKNKSEKGAPLAPVVENHAPIEAAQEESVSAYAQYKSIKDPIARNIYFKEHETEIINQSKGG